MTLHPSGTFLESQRYVKQSWNLLLIEKIPSGKQSLLLHDNGQIYLLVFHNEQSNRVSVWNFDVDSETWIQLHGSTSTEGFDWEEGNSVCSMASLIPSESIAQ